MSMLPFVFAGIAVSHYYQARRSDRARATYALDLAGAALACAVSALLLIGVGADGALLLLAGLAAIAAGLASIRVAAANRWERN